MNIGIVGMGLMGGSIGRALLKRTEHSVFGYDTDKTALQKAALLDAMHAPLTEELLPILDILIFAINPAGLNDAFSSYLPFLKEDALVSDIAGNKRNTVHLMREAARSFPHLRFVAAHPMAGREFSGISHASPSLFEGASVLLIPAATDIKGLALAKHFFLSLGFQDAVLTNEEVHDKMIAYTSQLAHLISSAYIQNPLSFDHDGFSAGSFRDLSRVAKMNVPMWTALTLENRDNLLPALDTFLDTLQSFRHALHKSDAAALTALFAAGNERKEDATKNTRAYKRSRL